MSEQLEHKIFRAFLFEVDIDGAKTGFKSANGLRHAMSFEPLQVGGMNGGAFMLPVPMKEAGKVTLEGGKYFKRPKSLPLPGTMLSQMSISVYNDDDSFRVSYTINAPVVEAIELAGLDAMSSEVLIEKLIVSYRSMEEKLTKEKSG